VFHVKRQNSRKVYSFLHLHGRLFYTENTMDERRLAFLCAPSMLLASAVVNCSVILRQA